jgi:hypothetical protein
MKSHEYVRGLDVAMDDALLMRVLDGMADLNEQGQSFAGGQALSSQYSVMRTPRTNSITT